MVNNLDSIQSDLIWCAPETPGQILNNIASHGGGLGGKKGPFLAESERLASFLHLNVR